MTNNININQSNQNEMTIKDYIIEYQKDNNRQQLISTLINYPIMESVMQEDNSHDIRHLQFNDKLMNQWLFNIKTHYQKTVSREDIEDATIDFMTHNNCWDNVDLSKSKSEIASYIKTAFVNHFKTYFKDNLHFGNDVITEHIDTHNEYDDIYTQYDNQDYNDWLTDNFDESYNDYIEIIGGLESVLTKRQLEVLELSQIKSQRAVADELNVTEASVSRTLTQADKRLKKNYTAWRATQIIKGEHDKSVVDEIKQFLDNFDMVASVDVNNQFDYFSLILNWLKDTTDINDFNIDYDELQKNKWSTVDTVLDAITDNITGRQVNIVESVLQAHVRGLNEDKTFTKRQQDTFVKAIVQALYKYLESIESSVIDFIGSSVDQFARRNDEKLGRVDNDDYDKLIRII